MKPCLRAVVSCVGVVWATQEMRAQVTLTPSSHDYGRLAVRASVPHKFTLGGVTRGDSIVATLEGPDAADWTMPEGSTYSGGIATYPPGTGTLPCGYNPNAFPAQHPTTCDVTVYFYPGSVGRKQALLRVTHQDGRTATAILTGTAVTPLCTITVVPCNYAHLYDGTFSWTHNIQGQAGSTELGIQVAITQGQAVCTGTQVSRGADGQAWTGSIVGPGLLGVEFIQDPMYPLAYRITVACPSAKFPDHPDGSKGWDAKPAEVGKDFSIVTDPQPARVAGEPIAGAITFPAPETDPDNGVTGAVAVQWNLWRTGTPQPPPPAPRGPP